jgi:tetratricopeptide (TPR) repeat protein
MFLGYRIFHLKLSFMQSFRCTAWSKFICILVAAVVSVSLNCSAQQKKIDSLKKSLPNLKDTARIDCLLELSSLYFCTPEKDSAIPYTQTAYEESKKLNYIHGLAVSFIRKSGIAICIHNDYPQTEKYAREALNWFSLTSNKKELSVAYLHLGRALTNQSHYDEALTSIQLAYQLAKKEGDENWMGSALETMTDIYRDRGDYVKLLESQQELVKRDRRLGDNGYYSFHELWVLGLMYRLLEEYATALPFWRRLFLENGFIWSWNQMEYAELLTFANEPDSALYYYNKFDSAKADIKDLRFFLISKGEYYLYLKQYNTALPYFSKGLRYHQQLNDRRQINRTLIDLAKTYEALHINDSAIYYARQGLAMALQTKAKPLVRDGYEILYNVYDGLQQDSAYVYYKTYIKQKEAVMNDQTRGKLAAFDYQHKIEMLDKEKQLQQQQLVQTAQQRELLLFGIAGILLFGFIVIRNIFLKRKNEINRRRLAEQELLLQKSEAERTGSEFRQKASELEMQALRAQMNPHFIFNSLNSINHFILQNNKLQASGYLTKFSRLVRLILQNSQAAFISLDNELEALQLYLELEALRFDHHFVYTINVEENIDPAVLKVSPLLIQPYAENAIWHGLMNKSEKGHLDITFILQERVLLCKITDDGVGRKKAAELKSKSTFIHNSMGMKITADRITLLHEEKQLNSYITINDLVLPDGGAGGTEVILKIPVHND